MNTDTNLKNSAGLTYDVLPPEALICGPKAPRDEVVIPEWVDFERVKDWLGWSAGDEDRLATAVVGTTPIGRELIQKILWNKQKNSQIGRSVNSEICRSLLNVNELNLLESILASGGTDGAFLADNLWRMDYWQRPPSMEEFLTETRYLGAILHPDRGEGIWPVWFRILCDEFDRDSLLNNIVLTGALGIGKTTVLVVILLYRICLLLLLKRPAEMFGQGSGSALYFVIVSVTKAAAQQTAFAQAVSLIAASPFFQKMSGIKSARVPYGGDIELATAGSNETHIGPLNFRVKNPAPDRS